LLYQMKKIKIYTLLLFVVSINFYSCKSAGLLPKETSNVKKFNVAYFNKYKIDKTAYYTSVDGTQFLLKNDESYYFEQIKDNANAVFSFKYRFFKSSLELMSSCQFFYNIPIGEYLEYDQYGKLKIKKNCDSPYLFSINDLMKKND
jgi:hypothetical protein